MFLYTIKFHFCVCLCVCGTTVGDDIWMESAWWGTQNQKNNGTAGSECITQLYRTVLQCSVKWSLWETSCYTHFVTQKHRTFIIFIYTLLNINTISETCYSLFPKANGIQFNISWDKISHLRHWNQKIFNILLLSSEIVAKLYSAKRLID